MMRSLKTTAAIVAIGLAACGQPETLPTDESVDVAAPIVAPTDIRARLAHEFEWAEDYPVTATWNEAPGLDEALSHELPPTRNEPATSQFALQIPAR
jgi:hypothetical protein